MKRRRCVARWAVECCISLFAFVPMFLAYSAILIDPKVFGDLIATDSQMVLPNLILQHTPLVAQVFFFGALLSAIMSTASATLLAPSVMFTENILKHFALKHMSDKQMLRTMRIIVVTFGAIVLWFALHSNASIFKMVENAYKITLVAAFVPLAFGLYWKRANTQGALVSIVLGLASWLLMEILEPKRDMAAAIGGLADERVWNAAGILAAELDGQTRYATLAPRFLTVMLLSQFFHTIAIEQA